MTTRAEAEEAKEKFKEAFWSKEPDKYNVLGLSAYDLDDDETEWYIVVYLFNIKDAEELPDQIDGVYIDYLSVMKPKKEEK